MHASGRRHFHGEIVGGRPMTNGDRRLYSRVLSYLRSLGDTPEAVAGALAEQGIRGRRRSARRCPVAVGIERHIGNYLVAIEVVGGVVRVSSRLRRWDKRINFQLVVSCVQVRMPEAARTFADRFDEGDFDALLEPEAASA